MPLPAPGRAMATKAASWALIPTHHPQNLLRTQFTCGNTRHTAKQNAHRLPIWQTPKLYSTCAKNSNCFSLMSFTYIHGNWPSAFQRGSTLRFPKGGKKCYKNHQHEIKRSGPVPSPESDLWGAFPVDGVTGATQPVGDPPGRAHHYPAICRDAQDVLLCSHRRPLEELPAFLNALLYHWSQGHFKAEVAIRLWVQSLQGLSTVV